MFVCPNEPGQPFRHPAPARCPTGLAGTARLPPGIVIGIYQGAGVGRAVCGQLVCLACGTCQNGHRGGA